jgi:hypothetical protein
MRLWNSNTDHFSRHVPEVEELGRLATTVVFHGRSGEELPRAFDWSIHVERHQTNELHALLDRTVLTLSISRTQARERSFTFRPHL